MPRRTWHRPAKIAAVAQRLERYRNNPERRRRLPEGLWRQAAELARQHGLCRVQRALRLNYHALKRRLEALSALPAALSADRQGREGDRQARSAPVPAAVHGSAAGVRPAFVEFQVPAAMPASAATLLEVEDRTGRRLSVRLAQESSGELVALARALWGGAP